MSLKNENENRDPITLGLAVLAKCGTFDSLTPQSFTYITRDVITGRGGNPIILEFCQFTNIC